MSKKILNGLEILEKIKNNELSISQEVSAVGNSPRGSIKFVLDKIDIIEFINMNFELIEDEIDIDSIEEFEIDKNNFIQTKLGAFKTRKMDIAFLDKINELIQAVNQLNKEIKKVKGE